MIGGRRRRAGRRWCHTALCQARAHSFTPPPAAVWRLGRSIPRDVLDAPLRNGNKRNNGGGSGFHVEDYHIDQDYIVWRSEVSERQQFRV